jgi:hypothetical protein
MRTLQCFARLVACALPLVASASLASAQVLFLDDFEDGLADWSTSGLWNAESATDTCGSQAPTWPLGTGGAYFGNANCDFSGEPFVGSLTLQTPIAIPDTLEGIVLSFWSYDETECDSCGWDWRFVYVSRDAGANWEFVGESAAYQAWVQTSLDISEYRGDDILLRFEFDAVDNVSNQFLGWLIDEVRVEVACPEPTYYCPGFPNSTGTGAVIEASGSTSVAANDFHLSVSHAPAGQMGIFFFGPEPASTPFGNGRLCIGVGTTGTVRLRPAQPADANGELSRQVDLTTQPAAAYIAAGDQRFFQFWYRDPAGGGFNLSSAVRVHFCP